ncbi:nitroreductase family protein [Streptococcus loxodontisalivarius]|uniref:Nitroreductase n=1 Tax=Streptococcus loxodontisalivarius TaxID=1349415 RepID=A0ABS2PUK3_9STRE|nr:nitroreductase family protein [Streptococcus loxodontisalivarius]MBM7643724.1 nitroreductase [Streptococcus loxodontisalivarius]
MKFLELNKKRHAYRRFNDKEVDVKDIRTAIEIASLAPSANNVQPWKFVIVKEKKDQLADLMYSTNRDQGLAAQYVIAIFSDSDLAQRARKVARIGVKDLPDDQIGYFMETLPPRFAAFSEEDTSIFQAFNTGLVTMNLALALTDQGFASNIIAGFDKSKVNEILDIDSRFRPEILVTVGYSDEKPEPSYRLPVDNIIEMR